MKKSEAIILGVMLISTLYLGLASAVFMYPHPNLSQMQVMVHLPTALTFGTLDDVTPKQ